MKVLINNTTSENIEFKDSFMKVASEVFKLEKISEKNLEISLTFVDQKQIKELNRDYRNVDKPTDVLSFPLFENKEQLLNIMKMDDEFVKDLDQDFSYMLGDIVICMEVAKKQAEEFGHSLERELMYLSCHSILHLLGYDHMEEDEKKQMRLQEKIVMKNLGVFK